MELVQSRARNLARASRVSSESMKTLPLFMITWLSAILLLLWLGDFNIYIKFPDGRVLLKQRADFQDRLLWSALIAAIYSLLNTGAVKCWQRRSDRQRKDGGPEI